MKNISITYFMTILVTLIVAGCSYPDSLNNNPKIWIDSTKIYSTAIVVNGFLDSDGAKVKTCGVCWENYVSYSEPDENDKTAFGSVGIDGRFSIKVTGLNPSNYSDNEYTIRVFALFDSGRIIYSDTIVLSTLKNDDIVADKAHLVTVNDVYVGDFTRSSVGLSAGVTVADGVEVLERGFCWSATSYSDDYVPSVTDKKIIVPLSDDNTTLSAVLKLENVSPHFIRAYVWTVHGVKYSTNTTKYEFDEKKVLPQMVPEMVVSDKMSKSVTFSASVDMSDFYGVTRRGFCWNTNATYKDPTIGDQTVVCDINSINEFSAKVTDLKSETYYKVRAFATNFFGTSYSDKVEFYTLKYSTLPVLERMPVEVSKTTTSITVSTKVRDSDSGDAITDRGFCWSKTSRTPTMDDNVLKCGSGAGEYTGVVDGLEPSMFIYVRGYAVNRLGVAYSQDYLFANTIYR